MDNIITQVQELAKNSDQTGRVKLLDSLRNLASTIETPLDTFYRFSGLQCQITVARIGMDLGIFNTLNASNVPISVETLASKTGAAPELLGRILRYMASEGQIDESSKDHFVSSSTTPVLADENFQGAIHHFFDIIGPAFQQLPAFLAETKYANVTNTSKTAFQKAFSTDLTVFAYMKTQPRDLAWFQKFMSMQRHSDAWLSVFPFKEEIGDFRNSPVFVDVGGGVGHQSVAVKEKFPELAGKIVLQDLPETVVQVPAIDGVEVMPHNFFEQQVVKGAKFYYLRNVLHDWHDEKAVTILKNLVPALGPDSRILINEMVLPNEKVHSRSARTDLVMLAILAGIQRTEEQWQTLIDAAGLQVLKIVPYTETRKDSIIVVAAK